MTMHIDAVNRSHPVMRLLERIRRLDYPPGVVATWDLVAGPEFFPGGCGLWHAEAGEPWPAMPERPVMMLGHNLDSVESFKANLKTGGIRKGPTWSNLVPLLQAAGVSTEDVFLTNFFMGLGEHQTGAFPGRKDPEFVADCLAVLRDTIRMLKPRAVVVLGGHTWRYVAQLSPALDRLGRARTFRALDQEGSGLFPNVELDGAPSFGVAVIVHPSGAMMGGNRAKRRLGDLSGLAAEAEMIRQASAP